MSKDLEKEYRALAQRGAPDLWSRIEAGLEEKPVSQPDSKSVTPRSIRAFWQRSRVWAGVAAACLCAALIIPAVTRSIKISGGSLAGDMASQSAAPPMEAYDSSAQEAEAPEAARADDYDASNDNGALPADMYDGALPMEAAQEAGVAEQAVSADSSITTTAASGQGDTPGSAERYNSFLVTVEILDMDVSTDSGVWYTAKVTASDHAEIEADSEVKIFSSAASEEGITALEPAQTYRLWLSGSDAGEEPLYLLQSVEE